ncbi:hypothetical protein B0O99DRAFT_616262 [Bisporella sp. PMI_857]|nr:hypothetical protein B0O99DRAFT_616262 [Bisporella sp. PMI_857]
MSRDNWLWRFRPARDLVYQSHGISGNRCRHQRRCSSHLQAQGIDYVFNSRTNKKYVSEVRKLTTNRLGGVLMCVGLPEKGVTFDALDIARGTSKVRGDSTGIPQRISEAIGLLSNITLSRRSKHIHH